MANQVSINLLVVNRSGETINNAPALLYYQDLSDVFNPTQGSIVQSGNTGGTGRVLFTGLSAGTYDIGVVTPTSGRTLLRNYTVKNIYSVVPGTTSESYESKSFTMAGTSTLSPGVLTRDFAHTGTNVAGKPDTLVIPMLQITGVNFYTDTIAKSKQSGNSYYHTTSSLEFSQNAKMLVD